MAKKTRAMKTAGRKRAAKRELIDTGVDERFVRRGDRGRFKESDDVGRSLSADRRKKANTKIKSGQGDRGDRLQAAMRSSRLPVVKQLHDFGFHVSAVVATPTDGESARTRLH